MSIRDFFTKLPTLVYSQFGKNDIVFITTTVPCAALWANYGMPLFKEFNFFNAIVLNIYTILPFILGMLLHQKFRKIREVVIFMIDNQERKKMYEVQVEMDKLENNVINNNLEFKSLSFDIIIWILQTTSVVILFIYYLRVKNSAL